VTLSVLGSKDGPPQFVPFNAPKVPDPLPGGIGHYEFAHIYRLDDALEYAGWDHGAIPCHLKFDIAQASSSEYDSYGIDGRIFLQRDYGPDNRPAVRFGPGVRAEVPWSPLDERIFNGTGSYLMSHNSAITPIYDNYSLSGWVDALGYNYTRTSANSHLKWHTRVKFNAFPEGDEVHDFITFDERYGVDNYAQGQVYLGIDSNGALICGTRQNNTNNNGKAVGPFTGSYILNSGQWYSVGLDANLRFGTGAYIALVLSGVHDTYHYLDLSAAGAVGVLVGSIPACGQSVSQGSHATLPAH